MLEFLLEVFVTIVVAVSAGYYIFLVGPSTAPAAPDDEGNCGGPSSDGSSSSLPISGPSGTESVAWLEALWRWGAAVALGSGSCDAARWSDKAAYTVHTSLARVSTMIEAKANPQSSAESELTTVRGLRGPTNTIRTTRRTQDTNALRLTHLEIGAEQPSLPNFGPIRSAALSTSPTSDGDLSPPPPRVVREFLVPLTYREDHFNVSLLCDLPLLMGLPPQLRIPADVLRLRAKVQLQAAALRVLVVLRMERNVITLYFRSPPVLQLQSSVGTPSSVAHRGGLHGVAPTSHSTDSMIGSKAGELLLLAARRALNNLVFPKTLRGEVRMNVKDQALHVVWKRETVDPAVFESLF